MKHRKAFTLIELLVVIAIIAILAAILFPVFAQAKAAAKKTATLSNIKQTSLGVIMYLSDSDDVFPMGCGCGWWYPRDGGWAWDTQPYIKNLPLLRDSSDPMPKRQWEPWMTGGAVSISMASNGFMAWDGAANSLFGLMGMAQAVGQCAGGGGWMGRGVTNQSAVNRISDTVMLTVRWDGNNYFGTGDMMSGNNWWDYRGPGLIPDGTRNGNPYQAPDFNGNPFTVNQNNRNGAVSVNYSNQGIFALADGSARTMPPVKTNPDPVNQPDNNMWNAYR